MTSLCEFLKWLQERTEEDVGRREVNHRNFDFKSVLGLAEAYLEEKKDAYFSRGDPDHDSLKEIEKVEATHGKP